MLGKNGGVKVPWWRTGIRFFGDDREENAMDTPPDSARWI